MKKNWFIASAVVLLTGLGGCTSDSGSSRSSQSGNSQSTAKSAESAVGTTESADGRILVAFFSRAGENYNVGVVERGNTDILAEIVHEQVGGDLFQIKTVENYPESYDEMTEVAQEERSSNARPKLATSIENVEQYDVIFLGYPIWWADMPMAMYTFLETYDFSGKTIIPFSTNEGSNLAGTVSSIQKVQPESTVFDGFTIRGQIAQEKQDEARSHVKDWLDNLSY